MSNAAVSKQRTRARTAAQRAYRRDANALTVAALSLTATGVALYDFCLLALSLH